MVTVGDLLALIEDKDLSDSIVVRPQWVPGKEPGDHEPGVCLRGVEFADDEVLLRVELFYLEDEEDE